MVRHHSSGSVATNGPICPCTPALLTSRSTGPISRSTWATMRSTSRRSVTSARIASAWPGPAGSCFAVTEISSSDRAQTATDAPASLSAKAMALPIPRPAPVTRATCPVRSVSVFVCSSATLASCCWLTGTPFCSSDFATCYYVFASRSMTCPNISIKCGNTTKYEAPGPRRLSSRSVTSSTVPNAK